MMIQGNAVYREPTAEDATGRVTVAQYSAEEVLEHFHALYACMDFKTELAEIGVGKFQLLRRKKALREFRALSIALWGLALQKSFPNDAQSFFAAFCKTAPFLIKGTDGAQLQNRVNIYVDLLDLKKDTDFLPVAAYLAEILVLTSEDMARLCLKLSLIMRNLYSLIFDKLV